MVQMSWAGWPSVSPWKSRIFTRLGEPENWRENGFLEASHFASPSSLREYMIWEVWKSEWHTVWNLEFL